MQMQIKYPGYLLNPGDMFSVDPELVMLSTGMPNSESKRRYVYNNPPSDAPAEFASIKNKSKRIEGERQRRDEVKSLATKPAEASQVAAETTAEGEAPSETPAPVQAAEASGEEEAMSPNKLKSRLQEIESKISTYLRSPLGKGYVFRTRRAKRIHALRELRRQVREAIKSTESGDASTLKPLTKKLFRSSTKSSPILSHLDASTKSAVPTDHLTLLQNWPNAVQQDKPYLTPWLPRNWMSAFAFIPRYLEVNQNVCSAVYLRHPVARPGLAEVPGPYGAETGLLAYQWYLRRR